MARFGRPVQTSRLPGPLLTWRGTTVVSDAPRGFDVIHSVSLAAARGPRPASGSRLVTTVHDLAWRRSPEATTVARAALARGCVGRSGDSVASVVVPSRLVAVDLETFGIEEGRITVVPGGADHLPDPDPAAADALLGRLSVRGEFLLSVGTLEPRKNLVRLAQAFARVRPSLPGPWTLVVVGPTGVGRPGPGAGPPGHRWSRLHGGGPNPGVGGAVPAGPAPAAYVPLTEGGWGCRHSRP